MKLNNDKHLEPKQNGWNNRRKMIWKTKWLKSRSKVIEQPRQTVMSVLSKCSGQPKQNGLNIQSKMIWTFKAKRSEHSKYWIVDRLANRSDRIIQEIEREMQSITTIQCHNLKIKWSVHWSRNVIKSLTFEKVLEMKRLRVSLQRINYIRIEFSPNNGRRRKKKLWKTIQSAHESAKMRPTIDLTVRVS